jgi:hypothetical protein
MTNYNLLDFQYFPSIIVNNIIIDENTLFFKSYEKKYNSLKDNTPSFFGSIDNATKYLTKDINLGIFSTKKEIKLLDIRYISQIINDLILIHVIGKNYNLGILPEFPPHVVYIDCSNNRLISLIYFLILTLIKFYLIFLIYKLLEKID